MKQNEKHIKYLKKFLSPLGDVPCFSVITILCEDFKISNVNKDDDIRTAVCSSLPAMEKAIQKIAESKPIVFDEAKKRDIYEYIIENQHSGKEVRWEHKQNVASYKEELQRMEDEKVCPKCKGALVLRQGKYGEFYGCSNYPRCRYTLDAQSDALFTIKIRI